MLAHWNNSLWVDMSLHSDTLIWFRANQSLLFLLTAACLEEKQATNTNFIVLGLTWPGLEPTIYRTRGDHANHYATDAVAVISSIVTPINGSKNDTLWLLSLKFMVTKRISKWSLIFMYCYNVFVMTMYAFFLHINSTF